MKTKTLNSSLKTSASANPNDSAPQATFIASTANPDRYGDIVDVAGWQLEAFKKNPVLLFAHKSRELPVGKVVKIGVEGDELIAYTEGPEKGFDDFADKVWAMIKKGFLNAVSVGFMPLEYSPRYDETGDFLGFKYTSQELLELSVVPTPANSEALAVARSMGFSQDDCRDVFSSGDGAIADNQSKKRAIQIIKLRALA